MYNNTCEIPNEVYYPKIIKPLIQKIKHLMMCVPDHLRIYFVAEELLSEILYS